MATKQAIKKLENVDNTINLELLTEYFIEETKHYSPEFVTEQIITKNSDCKDAFLERLEKTRKLFEPYKNTKGYDIAGHELIKLLKDEPLFACIGAETGRLALISAEPSMSEYVAGAVHAFGETIANEIERVLGSTDLYEYEPVIVPTLDCMAYLKEN